MTPSIFFTGASGYVGGDALYALLAAHPDWEEHTTCLLRDPTQEAAFRQKWPNLNFFYSSLDNEKAIEEEVKNHNLVLHFAVSSDHVASCDAILKGLSVNGGHYIHTSGMDVLLNPTLQTGRPSPVEIFDDLNGIEKLRSLPEGSPHRKVEKRVLSAGNDRVKTAIVCPSSVHGFGRGPVSQRSDQIPKLTQLILRAGHGLQLGDGKAFWSYVHVYDLSRLYVQLVDEAVSNGSKATWNELGYYLAENGEFSWGEVCVAITKEAYKQKALASENIATVPMEERDRFVELARPIINYSARSRAIRAKELLGWEPKETPLMDEIPSLVRTEIENTRKNA
ncbi:hypothetical protein PV08_03750 [Exophiala spinifera]|uniref:NAD-dependent epimerase/dehydratase domain-containing protein n=1 Tax=Exophiala spinifera TaxID=91928 RepID=A0A0D1ZV26_9EURO|nr:uncharacterized protein PV08_03750 [Exophiala spinifera]KIW16562.1 hypothetical protein PV08_03750 [Exophiala spinifera]